MDGYDFEEEVDVEDGKIGKLYLWDLKCLLCFFRKDDTYQEFRDRSRTGKRALTLETLLFFLGIVSSQEKTAEECLEMILRLNFTIVKFSYFDFKRSASLIDRLHRRNLVAKPHEIANAAVALNTGMKILVVDPKDCIYLSMFDDGDQDLA